MPSPSPRSPSARRKRREIPSTDTCFPVPVADLPLSVPHADPDDLDALKKEPGGQTSTSVRVVGLALDVVVELNHTSQPLGAS